jgi:hypothetical protein
VVADGLGLSRAGRALARSADIVLHAAGATSTPLVESTSRARGTCSRLPTESQASRSSSTSARRSSRASGAVTFSSRSWRTRAS